MKVPIEEIERYLKDNNDGIFNDYDFLKSVKEVVVKGYDERIDERDSQFVTNCGLDDDDIIDMILFNSPDIKLGSEMYGIVIKGNTQTVNEVQIYLCATDAGYAAGLVLVKHSKCELPNCEKYDFFSFKMSCSA